MLSKCVECDHIFADDEAEYLYKGKSYCGDCYRAVKMVEINKTFSSTVVIKVMSAWISPEYQYRSHRSEPVSNSYCSGPSQSFCACHDPHRPYINLDLEAGKTAGRPIQITKFANI
jgi:hypothetical protein